MLSLSSFLHTRMAEDNFVWLSHAVVSNLIAGEDDFANKTIDKIVVKLGIDRASVISLIASSAGQVAIKSNLHDALKLVPMLRQLGAPAQWRLIALQWTPLFPGSGEWLMTAVALVRELDLRLCNVPDHTCKALMLAIADELGTGAAYVPQKNMLKAYASYAMLKRAEGEPAAKRARTQ